ncbi:MAG: cellulase family glycosylhydrolase, partial [Armatimonadota bacterium]|nr:cellulase family glycosylhydrolase [Armatimonadota bacterium]
MKKLLLLLLTLSATSLTPAWGQRWEPRDKEFVLRLGAQEIIFQSPGKIRVGAVGGPRLDAAIFLWHDNWVYERLDSGQVSSGPVIDERGWLLQQGTWVSREGAAPMRYTLALEPTPAGAIVHLETQKTAPLKLTSGIWLDVSLNPRDFPNGQQIYVRPTAHAQIGQPVAGDADALLIELGGGQAVSFAGEGFSSVRSRITETRQGFEMSLRPGDFPVEEKAATTLKIAFTEMPREFPGDIKPQREKLAINRISAAAPTAGRLELSVDLRGTWDNPFDPEDVRLDALVTTAAGRTFTQPGFFLVDYRREVRAGSELMVPQGNGRWCVRLAVTEPGPLRCRLVAKDRSGTVSREINTVVVPPRLSRLSRGFIRQSRVDPHYLQFEDGTGFLPIGHNLPIYHNAGQTGADAIRKMAANGENYNRWWMSSSGFGIEWENRLGWYRQATASRLDAILDLAHELDFYYMLCFDTHQDFREEGWKTNPFNQANGGPCATVSDWFTEARARDFYKKRLRYIVARWGYSTNILCWEFGNEFEGWAETSDAIKIAWHREMAPYLAHLDPYRHLITTSWWSKTGPPECWNIPEMDIVQTHCYTNNDANVGEQVREYALHQWTGFPKPHIFGEFGIRSHESTADKDPQGWGLHNAFWSGLASGCCGIPMPWWHENYIEPQNLYFHFTAIRHFVKDLPFGTQKWEQVTPERVEYVHPPSRPIVQDAVITPVGTWGKPAVNEFVVNSDGSVNDKSAIHELLQGMGHPELRNPPTFVVNYRQPGQFIISVGKVSRSGLLKVWIDDELKLERAFPTGEHIGKSWTYQARWKLWESVYDEDVAVAIPAGQHRIRVDNAGEDWMTINRYTLTDYKVQDRPNLLVAALRASPGTAIIWLQNRESDWF